MAFSLLLCSPALNISLAGPCHGGLGSSGETFPCSPLGVCWGLFVAVVGKFRAELVLAQLWSIPFLSLPQCVPENGAAALALDFNDLLGF